MGVGVGEAVVGTIEDGHLQSACAVGERAVGVVVLSGRGAGRHRGDTPAHHRPAPAEHPPQHTNRHPVGQTRIRYRRELTRSRHSTTNNPQPDTKFTVLSLAGNDHHLRVSKEISKPLAATPRCKDKQEAEEVGHG